MRNDGSSANSEPCARTATVNTWACKQRSRTAPVALAATPPLAAAAAASPVAASNTGAAAVLAAATAAVAATCDASPAAPVAPSGAAVRVLSCAAATAVDDSSNMLSSCARRAAQATRHAHAQKVHKRAYHRRRDHALWRARSRSPAARRDAQTAPCVRSVARSQQHYRVVVSACLADVTHARLGELVDHVADSALLQRLSHVT
jgi:hypothetical protein